MRTVTLASTVLVLAALTAGCSQVQVVGRHRTLTLALTEYRIQPQSVRMSPGQLTIIVRNYGHRTHNLALMLDGQALESTRPLWPGMSTRLTVTLPKGKYLMASTVLSDQDLGEYGTLVVK